MSGFEDIERLIKQKKSEIEKRTSVGIHEHANFKRLLASLTTYKEKRPVTGFISVIINVNDIKSSDSANVDVLYTSIDQCVRNASNHLKIDESFNLIEYKRIHDLGTNKLRRIYQELSKDNYCVIVISATHSNYFIDGDEVGNAIFYTKKDQEKFEQRKEITELNQLLEDYRKHLTNRDIYQKFFVSKSGKKSLFQHLINNGKISNPENGIDLQKREKEFLKKNKNLLQNKPEDRFRGDLNAFLDRKLKGTIYINKEYILESFKRIDIFINDEWGELYLLEVKWLGISIHATGTKLGTEFSPKDINPEGVKQTIRYISELHKHKKDIKIGYLVVFDARIGEFHDSLDGFEPSVLDQETSMYYSRFVKINDFKVYNYHPN